MPILKQQGVNEQWSSALGQLKSWVKDSRVVGAGHWCLDYVLDGKSRYEDDVVAALATGVLNLPLLSCRQLIQLMLFQDCLSGATTMSYDNY